MWRAQIELQHARFVTPSLTVSMATGYLTSLATTFLVTLLITYRIVSVGRATFNVQNQKRGFRLGCWGLAGDYSKVVEIVVESAALSSASLIAFLISFKLQPTNTEEITGILGVITVRSRSCVSLSA